MVPIINSHFCIAILRDRRTTHNTVTAKGIGLRLVVEGDIKWTNGSLDDYGGICSIIIKHNMIALGSISDRSLSCQERLADGLLPSIQFCSAVPYNGCGRTHILNQEL